MGDIQGDAFAKRKEFFINGYVNFNVSEDECERLWEKEVDTFDAIIKYAENGEPMRVWLDSLGANQCAYYFLCSILRKYDSKILLLYNPDMFGWQESDYKNLFDYATIKGKNEIELDAKVWDKLVADNKTLRIIEDGAIKSVDIDYYDDFILSIVPEKNITIGELAGEANGRKIKMTYSFVVSRIVYLLKQGKFEEVGYLGDTDDIMTERKIIRRKY